MTANVEVTIQIKSVPRATGCDFYIFPRNVLATDGLTVTYDGRNFKFVDGVWVWIP